MPDVKVYRERTPSGRDWKFIDEARFDPEVHKLYPDDSAPAAEPTAPEAPVAPAPAPASQAKAKPKARKK